MSLNTATEFLTATEVAHIVRRSRSALLKALQRKEIGRSLPPAVKVGRLWLFPVPAYVAWRDALMKEALEQIPARRGRPRLRRYQANPPQGQT